METKQILEELKRTSKKNTKWIKDALWQKENEAWLDRSFSIAVKVLRSLRAQNKTQKDLADAMSVSPQFVNKIVKGSENLTLETISKLEKALNLQLIEIPESPPYPYQSAGNVFIDSNYLPASVSLNTKAELVKEPECTSFSIYTFAA